MVRKDSRQFRVVISLQPISDIYGSCCSQRAARTTSESLNSFSCFCTRILYSQQPNSSMDSSVTFRLRVSMMIGTLFYSTSYSQHSPFPISEYWIKTSVIENTKTTSHLLKVQKKQERYQPLQWKTKLLNRATSNLSSSLTIPRTFHT